MIVGIDEVGRGCWAGPVVAGAVVLAGPVSGLTDSKQLTAHQREIMLARLEASGACIGLGWVDASTVDEIGLTEAVRLAMRRALNEINVRYDNIIIDGSYNFLADITISKAIVKADASIPAVSAASIAAKVARDEYMKTLPDAELYGYVKHVGYGTSLHAERLKLHGVTSQHRKSFKPIRALLQ